MRLTNRLFHLVALAAMLVGATVASAGPSGAIFTTDENGTFVNGNVYDSKDDVYLNGGPRPNAPCSAAGLPDGDYVFQVTDPSGHVLLSTDAASNRVVTISGGLIVAYAGTHAMGTGKCGSLTVALADPLLSFDTTPNPGGEYKVWLTPYVDGNFEFAHNTSKTDNFKVVPPDTIPD